MSVKRTAEETYEIYLPGKKDWSSLEQIHAFLKKIEKNFSFFQAGIYYVYVTTNEMGTLFQVELIENYVYKKNIDLKLELSKTPFYVKSPIACVFQKGCFYFQNFFYGKSNQITVDIKNFEFLERVSKEEYETAKRKGLFLKKRRGFSSL